MERCLPWVCFAPIDSSAHKIFGFPEYLAALALIVIAWTISDIRYRFRVATAPVPLHQFTFISVLAIGILTLLTDLWRAESWLVPRGYLLTPTTWQAILGAWFLFTFLSWAWFAFIKPPIFGKRNAQRFGSFIYWKILDGSSSEMAIIGQELIRSIPSLVDNAPIHVRLYGDTPDKKIPEPTLVQDYANDILLLMADHRFCRTLVKSSPGTILGVFQEINQTKKYGIAISQFGRNVVQAAIGDLDSFMYHETEGYSSGLLGYQKPLSQSIFANYDMVDEIDSILDPDYKSIRKWSAIEFEAYTRAVLIVFRSYVKDRLGQHSFVLHRAFSNIERSSSDLYKLNGSDVGSWESDTFQRLETAVNFCCQAIKILDENAAVREIHLRIREGDPTYYSTIYDELARLIFELVFDACSVRKPRDLCWVIQHNTVWHEFFDGFGSNGNAAKIIKFKVRRKIYDEIITAAKFPNYKNMKYLGFCLNVLGLETHDGVYGRDSRPLQKAVLSWTKQNFVSVASQSPQVVEECLPEGLTYDQEHHRIIRTTPTNAFRSEPEYFYFQLDKPPKSRSRKRSAV